MELIQSQTANAFETSYGDVRLVGHLHRDVQAREEAEAVIGAVQTLSAICFAHNARWWVDAKTGEDIRTNPYCISNKIALIHSELSEALEGDRKSLQDEKLPHRSALEVELGDALIRIVDLAAAKGLDLAGAIAEKLDYNKTREDHTLAARLANNGKAY